jgi:hypothetical protein
VTPFAIGLGEKEAVIQFRLSRLQAGRALHGDRHVAKGTHDHCQGLVIKSLDHLVFSGQILPHPTHLKIDVDGPELAILRGAAKTLTLPSLRYLLVELMDGEREEADKILLKAQFTASAEGVLDGGMRNVIYQKHIQTIEELSTTSLTK